MKVSFNLLKEFVDLPSDITAQDVAEKLTFAGIEVEDCYQLANATGLIVGEIISCLPHPSSDHLHLLKVDLGKEIGVKDIVCGAKNARVGLKTIVATIGAELKAIGVTIKESEILGYKSSGMCCSLAELGLSAELMSEEEKEGIYEFDSDVEVGRRDVLSILGLDDIILDVNVLANRPDLLSILGIAHEVAALYNLKVKEIPLLSYKKSNEIVVESKTEKCSTFCLLKAKTNGVSKTPVKLKNYLRNLGLRSLSLPVDLGNFMMLVTGQPFHFYDSQKVRSLDGEEKYVVLDNIDSNAVTLDDRNIMIKSGDLVVTDGKTAMCLGGVMGLKNVAIDEDSKEFGIESAYFDFASVRHTVNRTGLASDSSTRFIKKVNSNLTAKSLARLAYVYKCIDPSFEVISYSAYNDDIKENEPIKYSYLETNQRLGSDFSEKEIDDVFKRLNISKDKSGRLIPPIYRTDLLEQADFDEEVFRYNDPTRLDMSLSNFPSTITRKNDKFFKCSKISSFLVDRGLYEIVSYTLIDKDMDKKYRLFNDDKSSLKIANPMSDAHEYIRVDLASSMVKTIDYNLAHQKDNFGMFEIADLSVEGKNNTYLCIGLTGIKKTSSLLNQEEYDFFDLKGLVEQVLSLLNVTPNRYSLKRSDCEWLHRGRSAELYVGRERIAVLGQISPLHHLKPLYLAELDISSILKVKNSPTKFSKFSIYPEVERDFCFVLSKNITSNDLILATKRACGSSIKSIDVFDIYKIDDEKKSIAIRVRFSKQDGTFKDEEIKELMQKIIDSVKKNVNGVLR